MEFTAKKGISQIGEMGGKGEILIVFPKRS